MKATFVSFALIATLLSASPAVTAQAPEEVSAFSANVRNGTCTALGEVTAILASPASPSGDRVGQESATAVASSYSEVPLTLEALLAEAFAIDISGPDGDQPVACGEIGGAIDANGALSIGLRPFGDSGHAGVAYLAPAADPSLTGISLFLAPFGHAPARSEPAAMSEQAYATTVRQQVTLMVGSLQRVDALAATPQPEDSAWTDQLTAELSLWQMLHAEVVSMTPPPNYAAFHGRYTEALALFDSAASDALHALECGDQDLLAEASRDIDEAIQMLRELDAPDASPTPEAG